MSPVPIPPAVQAALQTVEDSIANAKQADLDAGTAALALSDARNVAAMTQTAQLSAHQQVTTDVQALIAAIQTEAGLPLTPASGG